MTSNDVTSPSGSYPTPAIPGTCCGSGRRVMHHVAIPGTAVAAFPRLARAGANVLKKMMGELVMQKTEAHTATSQTALPDREGKYLTFALAQEEYGLEILKVREIIGYIDVTAIPQTPQYVKGVINLRGQVIPVVDLRAKFGMDTTDVTDQTCIIVVEINHGSRTFSTGIVVDQVQEVLDVAGESIEEAPQFGATVDTDFILGIAKIGDSVKILLDIDKVLAGTDLTTTW